MQRKNLHITAEIAKLEALESPSDKARADARKYLGVSKDYPQAPLLLVADQPGPLTDDAGAGVYPQQQTKHHPNGISICR